MQWHDFCFFPHSRIPGDWTGNVRDYIAFSEVLSHHTTCSENPFSYDENDLGKLASCCTAERLFTTC